MFKINFKKILLNFILVLLIFFLDRFSKIYVLNLAELNSKVDIYLTPYLNLYLIWNKGIAFGLLSFEESFVYNATTLVIILVSLVVLIMVIRTNGFVRYSFISIFGGSLGNLFDRIYYTAVPDFIDFHINGFHWFIFNVADIFITTGVICLIYAEIFFNKEKNDKTL
jgi:signal peptidase II